MLKKITSVITIMSLVVTIIQFPVLAMDGTTIDTSESYAYDVDSDAIDKIELKMPNGYVQANVVINSMEKTKTYGFGTEFDDKVKSVNKIDDSRYLVLTRGVQVNPTAEAGAAVYLLDDQGQTLSKIALKYGYTFASEVWEEYGHYKALVGRGNTTEIIEFDYLTATDTLIQNGDYKRHPEGAYNSSIGGTTSYLLDSAMIDNQIYLGGQDLNDLNTGDGDYTRTYIRNINAPAGYGALMIDKYENVRTATSNPYTSFTGQLRETPSGYAGVYMYADFTYKKSLFKLYRWNTDTGFSHESITSADQHPMMVEASFTGAPGASIKFLSISTMETLYFQESCGTGERCPTKLYSWDLNNLDEPVLLGVFPEHTQIDVIENPNDISEPYLFYGYIPEYTGAFAKFDGVQGISIGYMNASFEPIRMGAIKATGESKIVYADFQDNGDILFIGDTTSKDLVSPEDVYPDGQYNDIAEVSHNGLAIRIMDTVDYAPGLQVGDALTVNKDTVTDWDAALLTDVNAYDVFDFNNGWSNADLNKRINRNPNNWQAPIDWQGLGLNTNQIGSNTVKYFVNDSQLQQTADSRIVNIVSNDTAIDTDKIALQASDFMISIDEAKTLTSDVVKNMSSVIGWRLTDGVNLSIAATVDQAQLAALNTVTKSEVLPLTFSLNDAVSGGNVSTTINVLVYDQDTVIDDENNKAITAQNFTVQSSQVADLTEETLIAAAAAKAWSAIDMSEVAVHVSENTISETAGVYDVTFATAKGTSKTVKATVFDDNTVLSDIDAVYAKDFTVDTNDVATLSDTDLITRAGARAWKLDDGSVVDVSVKKNDILAGAGAYNVTFATANDTEITVTATVQDGNTYVDPDKGEAIYAENFTVEVGEVEALTDTDIISKAGARAWRLSDGSALTVTADISAVKPQLGAYPVAFTSENGVSKTVYVSVIDATVIIQDGIALSATDFEAPASEYESRNLERAKERANVQAWDISSGEDLTAEVTVDYYNQVELMTYAVNFEIEKNAESLRAEKLITVTLIDDGSKLPDTGQNNDLWLLAGAIMLSGAFGCLAVTRCKNK